MNATIVVIIYKRTKPLIQLVEILKKVKPKKIYIIADGPKTKKEKVFTNIARSIIEKNIDWNCKINKIYSSKNLGLRKRIVTGLDKVFKSEEQAIILEDDCIPDFSFFQFCNQLLEKYKNNHKILSISGTTHSEDIYISQSYYFSKYFHSWGWATWKRAWKNYDDNMNEWKTKDDHKWLKRIIPNTIERIYWKKIFNMTSQNKINSWAYRWTYSHLKHGGLSIIPSKNLVSNVGFGKNATHNKLSVGSMRVKSSQIKFPLKHPKKISINDLKDHETAKKVYLSFRSIAGLIYKMISS